MSATINIVGTSAPNPAQTLKNVFAVTDTRGNHRTQEAHSCASPTGNLNGVGNSAEAEPTKKTCVYEYRRKRHAEWLKRHQHTAGQRKGEDAPISVPPLDFDNKRIRLLALVTEAANYNWRQCSAKAQDASALLEEPVCSVRARFAYPWHRLREFLVCDLNKHALLLQGCNASAASDKKEELEKTSPESVAKTLHGFGMFNLSRSLKYLDDIVKLKLEQLHGPFVCALLYATPCLQAYDVTSRSPSSVYSHRTSASPRTISC